MQVMMAQAGLPATGGVSHIGAATTAKIENKKVKDEQKVLTYPGGGSSPGLKPEPGAFGPLPPLSPALASVAGSQTSTPPDSKSGSDEGSDDDSDFGKPGDFPSTVAKDGGGATATAGAGIDYDRVQQALSDAIQANAALFGNPGPNAPPFPRNRPPPPNNRRVGADPPPPNRGGGGEDNRVPRDIVDKTETPLTDNVGNRELGLQVLDESTATLRPLYGVGGGAQVIPPVNEQIRSDIEFDLFNLVQPGHGLGSDNKMFLYQQAREDLIRFKRPLYTPNVWLGPSNYQHPLPWQWQNVKAEGDVRGSLKMMNDSIRKIANLVDRMGERTTEVLGRDVGESPASISSSGLRRDANSPFEPVIQNRHNWTPILDPVGKDLDAQRGYKRLFSALRDPDAVETQVRNGGPTLRKRRALEVILP